MINPTTTAMHTREDRIYVEINGPKLTNKFWCTIGEPHAQRRTRVPKKRFKHTSRSLTNVNNTWTKRRTIVSRPGGPCCSDQRLSPYNRRRNQKSENATCIYERAFVTSVTSPCTSGGLRDPSNESTLRNIGFVGQNTMLT